MNISLCNLTDLFTACSQFFSFLSKPHDNFTLTSSWVWQLFWRNPNLWVELFKHGSVPPSWPILIQVYVSEFSYYPWIFFIFYIFQLISPLFLARLNDSLSTFHSRLQEVNLIFGFCFIFRLQEVSFILYAIFQFGDHFPFFQEVHLYIPHILCYAELIFPTFCCNYCSLVPNTRLLSHYWPSLLIYYFLFFLLNSFPKLCK